MILVLAAHLVFAALAAAFGRRLGPRVMLLASLAPATSVLWLLSAGRPALSGGTVTESLSWVPGLGLEIAFVADGFAALMVALVGGIGVLIFLYAWKYFGPRRGLGRFAAYLVLFAGAMFGLVTSDNLLALFLFWELTSITSYLLIGFEDDKAPARAGALQALLVTGVGGLAMLAGIVVVAGEAGTYSLAELVAAPPTTAATATGLALILLGAFTKSAQFPFHFWLPGAMTAPTPVSAYLHSATMVKAGVYLVARLAPAFAPVLEWWRPTLVAVGVGTMLVGGWRALAQHDLKLILAQGTVSQLGFMMTLVGIGTAEVVFAGMAMIFAHAVFKAALFMVAGVVDHQTHTRDIRRLTGLARRLPATFGLAAVATASMAGLPPLLGFVSKEAALEALIHEGGPLAVAGVVAGSILTVAYGLHFLQGGFGTASEGEDLVGPDTPKPKPAFLLPAALLTVVTVAGGLAPRLVDPLVAVAAGSLVPGADTYYLALWHGLNLPLALSALAVGLGALVWRRPLPRLRRLTARLPAATSVYNHALTNLTHGADRLTAIVQNGSLPIYLGVILTTAVVAPGVVMARHWVPPDRLLLAESPIQAVVALLVVMAAVGTVGVRHRLGAVLFLGAVGYGVALLFVLQGAPDLALTQLLIETLTLVLFILVLRHLPVYFEGVEWQLGRITRVVIACLVGVSAGGFAMWAAGSRRAAPLVGEYLTRAEPEGGGRNVVNVILTDFRALDTLGEITVVAVAALGVASLAHLRRRHRLDLEEQAEEATP